MSTAGKVDASGEIQHFFFSSHKGSIHLDKINHHVALLDATYKKKTEASVVIPTFIHNLFKKALVHSHRAYFTMTVQKHLHIQKDGVWMSAWLEHAACQLQEADQVFFAVNLFKNIWCADQVPKVFITDRENTLHKTIKIHDSLKNCGILQRKALITQEMFLQVAGFYRITQEINSAIEVALFSAISLISGI
ncbi:uncharacterized protein VP01_2606g3 [Puccinia sorghi]|uniref:MULE transposase domain-containing protein n=1 Tax=Puccinia sorghi TaxID=27349 RepID=A0A0L6V6D9_9BASI|nr:uncharacterized protein VP01_2606g3 [Puccinia sorghi]